MDSDVPIPGTRPVLLPDKNNLYEQKIVEIFGWGETFEELDPDQLHSTYVNTITNDDCRNDFRFNQALRAAFDNIICSQRYYATYLRGLSSGDLGAPACLRNSDNDTSELCEIVGLYMRQTPGPERYDVYTRVSAHSDWIRRQASLCGPQNTRSTVSVQNIRASCPKNVPTDVKAAFVKENLDKLSRNDLLNVAITFVETYHDLYRIPEFSVPQLEYFIIKYLSDTSAPAALPIKKACKQVETLLATR